MMTDEELVSLCERVKTQVRGPVLDICMEVLDRYAAKNLATKPAMSRDMAKYMREWRARKKPVAEAKKERADNVEKLLELKKMLEDQKALASVPKFPTGCHCRTADKQQIDGLTKLMKAYVKEYDIDPAVTSAAIIAMLAQGIANQAGKDEAVQDQIISFVVKGLYVSLSENGYRNIDDELASEAMPDWEKN